MFRRKDLDKENITYDVIDKLIKYSPDEMDKIVTLAKEHQNWITKVRDLNGEENFGELEE